MYTKIGLGVLCATLWIAGPAFAAVTVTNQDSHPQTIIVDRGATETQQDIAQGKAADVKCPADCGFRVEGFGYSRTAGGDAKLVIDKDGELHFLGGHGDMVMPDGSN